MGTEANKSILAESGLLTEQVRRATPNDLVIAINAVDASRADQAIEKADQLLKVKVTSGEPGVFRPKTLRGALASNPGANLAVISVAGRYAAEEAWEALYGGLHVLLFSDNVSLEDEIALKSYARDHGLLLMGPGAGTAILNGVALGFANALPSGPVGIVSAAGTGLQEVSSLLARRGVGLSQGIGTGGRDLKEDVGGIMMLEALKALQADPATEVVVLISKPPGKQVVETILKQVAASKKPTVVCFLGGELQAVAKVPNAIPARTLYECSLLAAREVLPEIEAVPALLEAEDTGLSKAASRLKSQLIAEQKYLRGLYSGGTLCYEAQVIWKEMLSTPIHSNTPLPGGPSLPDPTRSQGHSAVDLGEEQFTVGRPHPMIDNDLRVRRLLQESQDPEVGVIVLDVVLGYGAHPDPASELGSAVHRAQANTRAAGRELAVIASVTGTPDDPQGFAHTVSTLEQAGGIVCESNYSAARLAGLVVSD
jgi:FdrA protein